ncbi:hypothetical protein [Prosthecobacter sp.]|uniref:hypothetical protein n=1 Tax=Prosthecobacter sp. TaxID=1965333 RepID=UPI002ABA6CE3|nr:hypothetical protein [Prosthecobacter sp.]MDZ4403795.1 hypothetical protein [Prosthecobacter sp.]
MRLLPTIGAVTMMLGTQVMAQPGTRLVWQPVQEYFIHRDETQQVQAGTKRLNSFTAYTHIGTDFGFHGQAEHEMDWLTDEIVVHLSQQPDAWAGMWHSLAGQARNANRVMDFTRAYPEPITAKHQPRVSAVMIEAAGRGKIKLEIKSPVQELRWSQMIELNEPQYRMFVYPVASEAVRDAKTLVWTAEPGSEVKVSGLFLGVELPQLPWDAYAFLASFAKIARSYSIDTGFVRDRAHIEEGAFESVSATGMYVLASAAAAQESVGVVTPDYARWVLARTHEAVKKLQTARGLLPHFVHRRDNAYRIHPNTEYSTVDTAIYAQSMLLAATMLGVPAVAEDMILQMQRIEYDLLRLPDGHLSHGLADDGVTLLPHGWQDWGGETALVMLMEGIANPQQRPPPMRTPGKAWQGTGFITEVQSLFHPDFDSDAPDAHDGVRWLSVRRAMFGAQRAYLPKRWPQSQAARHGIYGLSAGENQAGNSYHVGGVDLPDQKLVHPHYVLMSATLHTQPAEIYELLERMEKAGYFPPWGMVENLDVDGRSYLPMEGALNAGFEALSAYHLLAKHRQIPDAIHQASQNSPQIRRAMQLFYPQAPSDDSAAVEAAAGR